MAAAVIEKIGGASRDRTDDLIVANDNALRLRHPDFNNLESDYVPLRSENLDLRSRWFANVRFAFTTLVQDSSCPHPPQLGKKTATQ